MSGARDDHSKTAGRIPEGDQLDLFFVVATLTWFADIALRLVSEA